MKPQDIKKYGIEKLKEYPKAYGEWAGCPKGQAPDFNRCARVVYTSGSYISSQCSRSNGYGPGEAYCKQHATKPNLKLR